VAHDAPRRRGDVTLQRVGNEAILHDEANRRTHVINGSAALAWELCDGRSFDEIVAAFAAHFGVEDQRVRADLEKVLGRFLDQGLLQAA
jgi:hypothetical protein